VSEKPRSWNEIRNASFDFVRRFQDETDENAEAQAFWTEFLGMFGIDRKRVNAIFEDRAHRADTGGRGRIDMFWPGQIAVEHKSKGKDLKAATEQCLTYLHDKPDHEWPKAIVTSDFARIRITDLMGEQRETIEFPIKDLPSQIERFAFLAGYDQRRYGTVTEQEANIQAAKLMGRLFEQVADTGYDEHETSVLLIRLLFIMFADDTGLWRKDLFAEFIDTRTSTDGHDLGGQLEHLFQVLDRPEDKRLKGLDEILTRFPYVNGGLFSDRLPTVPGTQSMRDMLITCTQFNWATISPAVFGSLFQAVKSKEARRALGEHYTSEENILKVINPLFMDELRAEFTAAGHETKKLEKLRKKMGAMTFLDPACGCGNFLVVAYREMRRLEFDIMRQIASIEGHVHMSLDPTLGLQVQPHQFYGIEIEEWPAQIAETAMFLVDHQENVRMQLEFGNAPERLPITESPTIIHGNALRIDWRDVCPIDDNTRIMGNPPFAGSLMLDSEQKADAKSVWGENKRLGTMDYVTSWFVKASRLIELYGCEAAFVSTNSITQGEQVGVLWKELLKNPIEIGFAHQTFSWSNESPDQAAVHVVIVGLRGISKETAKLYIYEDIKGNAVEQVVESMNAYLIPGSMQFVSTRLTPISPGQVHMKFGSMPRDGGWLSKISGDEAEEIRTTDPIAGQYLRPLVGARELLHDDERWCLWLVDATPTDVRSSSVLTHRLSQVKKMRSESKASSTRNMAATPGLFAQNGQPTTNYLAVPRVSSERRDYVPMAIFPPSVIASDALLTIADATTYTFGMLHSSVFNVWNGTVSGRLESRFRISAEITYNNFPWPTPTDVQREAIDVASQAVMDARENYPDSTLADLYDPLSMPTDLLKAHKALDKAVLSAYGLPAGATDTEILAELFKRYEALTKADQLPLPAKKAARKRAAKKT
jgi:hypothetical protein